MKDSFLIILIVVIIVIILICCSKSKENLTCNNPDYPYLINPNNDYNNPAGICYNQQSYAQKGTGPLGSWCYISGSPASEDTTISTTGQTCTYAEERDYPSATRTQGIGETCDPQQSLNCKEGAFCGDAGICLQQCVTYGQCKEAGEVPRGDDGYCNYQYCFNPGENVTCNICPRGWIPTTGAHGDMQRVCVAPEFYDGPCDKVSEFNRYTSEQATEWANNCGVDWPNPCGSGCCYCIHKGAGPPTHGWAVYPGQNEEEACSTPCGWICNHNGEADFSNPCPTNLSIGLPPEECGDSGPPLWGDAADAGEKGLEIAGTIISDFL